MNEKGLSEEAADQIGEYVSMQGETFIQIQSVHHLQSPLTASLSQYRLSCQQQADKYCLLLACDFCSMRVTARYVNNNFPHQ